MSLGAEGKYAEEPGTVDFDRIRALLPVSYPFLMIDRVLAWEAGTRIVTRKCVTGGESYFQGHFTKGPAVVPGVLLVEAIAQSALLLGLLGGEASTEGTTHMLAEAKAVFRASARPGDVIEFEVSVGEGYGAARSYTGVGRVDGRLIVKAELLGVAVRT